jgi:membrane fusion protein, multidrug efflux system
MKCASAVGSCIFLLALAGCGPKTAAPPPPPPVNFAVAGTQDVPLTIQTFGNAVSIADVTLQAQVTGNLTRYAVAEGAMVKAGDLIIQIDPGPFQAAVEEAQGNLDSAKAQLANTQVTLVRQQALFKTKTIDLADLQTAEANQLQAQGSVQTAEGDLANAQINLGFCTIKSPIDGKTGVYMVDAGNLVTANTSKLINIQTIDPIYVEFTISENDFDTVRQYFKNGSLPVEVTIPGAPDAKIPGSLTFIDNTITSQTGTLTLRATFPNKDGRLWPGLFVNVSLILSILKDAVTVPSPCIMIGQNGPYVFTVNDDNTVAQQWITIKERRSDFTVIETGIQAGQKVVTAGQLGLYTGAKVRASLWQAPVSSDGVKK